MADKGGAYEHQAETTGLGSGGGGQPGEQHMEGQPGARPRSNEVDVEGRNRDLPDPDELRQPGRTQPHGPETHQDTRVARKSGA